jgi:hypothetical protein
MDKNRNSQNEYYKGGEKDHGSKQLLLSSFLFLPVLVVQRYDTHTPKGLPVSKKHKAAKAADQKKANKSSKKESKDDPTPSKKQKQIEEDSEEYLEDDNDEDDEDYSDLDSEDDDDIGGDVVDFDLNEEFKMVRDQDKRTSTHHYAFLELVLSLFSLLKWITVIDHIGPRNKIRLEHGQGQGGRTVLSCHAG